MHIYIRGELKTVSGQCVEEQFALFHEERFQIESPRVSCQFDKHTYKIIAECEHMHQEGHEMEKLYKSVNEFYDGRLFKINKKYLEILGRWPYQAKHSRIFLLSLYFVGIATVVTAEVQLSTPQ